MQSTPQVPVVLPRPTALMQESGGLAQTAAAAASGVVTEAARGHVQVRTATKSTKTGSIWMVANEKH